MNGERIVEFVQLLRDNGLRVSPTEGLDAVRALDLIGFEDKESVRTALRATLVKRGPDAAMFERIFKLYVEHAGRLLQGLEARLGSALDPENLTPEERRKLVDWLQTLTRAPLAQAVLDGDLADIARQLRSATLSVDFRGLKSPLQRESYARRVGSEAGIAEVRDAFRGLLSAMSQRGFEPTVVKRVSLRLHDATEALEEAARRAAQWQQQAREPQANSKSQNDRMHRAWASLRNDELVVMRSAVTQMADKLKVKIASKRRERRRGQLNVRRTLRRNMDLGGVPARLSFRKRRPQRPEIVILCDVSDSVRNVSELMMQFVHTLQSLYARVRTFVFVSELGEITTLLKTAPIARAVDGDVAGNVINLSANSNYGQAFRQFRADHLDALTRRATLVVIGDGRSNHQAPHAQVLEELAARTRRVVWLCPEDRPSWGLGDSDMHRYARHCDQVFVVRTLDELATAAEKLLP